MASAFEVFTRAERLERASAELYGLLSRRFPWSDEDRALLQRLAEEATQHAARVRLLSAQYRNDPRTVRVDAAALASVELMERAIEELVADIQRGRWNDDLVGLKARIADLEGEGQASHADLLAEGSDPRVKTFFRELARQDHSHRALLLGSVLKTA